MTSQALRAQARFANRLRRVRPRPGRPTTRCLHLPGRRLRRHEPLQAPPGVTDRRGRTHGGEDGDGARAGCRFVTDPDAEVEPDGTTDVVTVLGNLLDNAVDAAGPGARVSSPGRAHRRRPGRDDPGVPAAERERIFEPGVSTKRAAHLRHRAHPCARSSPAAAAPSA